MRVFCRVRPMPERAGGEAAASTYCMPDGASVRLSSEPASEKEPATFTYDKVFAPAASQADVFNEVASLVQSALDGYKVNKNKI